MFLIQEIFLALQQDYSTLFLHPIPAKVLYKTYILHTFVGFHF